MKIGLIGASGITGKELLLLLEERAFPLTSLRCFGSKKSMGKTLLFQKRPLTIETLSKEDLTAFDLVFCCARNAVAKEWGPQFSCPVIDLSSAFRKTTPLIIPEINAHQIPKKPTLLASPNCAATILLLPLAPLHYLFHAKRVTLSTYQAASGGGKKLLDALKEETNALSNHLPYKQELPHPYAFNVFLHNAPLTASGYSEEEEKVMEETKRILDHPTLEISATCVRVPTLRAHALSVQVAFEKEVDLLLANQTLKESPGVLLKEYSETNRFVTPSDAAHQDPIFVSRVRKPLNTTHVLEFWAVGDQLRKGAALNALQIAEHLLSRDKAYYSCFD